MGVQVAKKEEKLGIRASSTCTLNFDNLEVPQENIIGGEGKGYKVRSLRIHQASCETSLVSDSDRDSERRCDVV